jgi:hypothetical protein
LPGNHKGGAGAIVRPHLSQRIYYALKWGAPLPYEVIRWQLVERFKWTLEYVDGLSLENLHELIQVDDGISKSK